VTFHADHPVLRAAPGGNQDQRGIPDRAGFAEARLPGTGSPFWRDFRRSAYARRGAAFGEELFFAENFPRRMARLFSSSRKGFRNL
jgi:hypothetical protein